MVLITPVVPNVLFLIVAAVISAFNFICYYITEIDVIHTY